MGASKNHLKIKVSTGTSLFGRAISNRTRIEILNELMDQKDRTNIQLCRKHRLAKSTIHEHLKKLSEAGLITMDFYPNCYLININEEKRGLISYVIEAHD